MGQKLFSGVIAGLWVFYNKLASPGKRSDLPSNDGRIQMPTWYDLSANAEKLPGWQDVIAGLWVFYNKLKAQGQRSDLTQNCVKLPTWFEWLKTKGIAPNTPLNHFKRLGWIEEKPKMIPEEYRDSRPPAQREADIRSHRRRIWRAEQLLRAAGVDPCGKMR